jgi:YVTN family beta-propeller protein
MAIEQAGTGGNTVSVVDLESRKRVGVIDLGRFRRPHGIDLDRRTGRILVSCELPDQLLVLDPVARRIVRSYETKGKTAHMVALGPDGRHAYVSNSNSAAVSVIDLASGGVASIATGARPEGSVLSPYGSGIYVVNR